MVKINLADGYFIEAVDREYTLKKVCKYNGKDGEEKEKIDTIGFYGNFDKAIKRFLECIANREDAEYVFIKSYANKIDECCTHAITAICNLIKTDSLAQEVIK